MRSSRCVPLVSGTQPRRYSTNVTDVQGNGRAALHYTAGYGNVDATRRLLDSGANVDVADKAGMTPLHFAAQMGQSETAELLLQYARPSP
jgi:ankyrin repeat protein